MSLNSLIDLVNTNQTDLHGATEKSSQDDSFYTNFSFHLFLCFASPNFIEHEWSTDLDLTGPSPDFQGADVLTKTGRLRSRLGRAKPINFKLVPH